MGFAEGSCGLWSSCSFTCFFQREGEHLTIFFNQIRSEQRRMHSNCRQRGRNQNSSREIPPQTDFPTGYPMENEVGANPVWREPSRMTVGSCDLHFGSMGWWRVPAGFRVWEPVAGERDEELFVGGWVCPSSPKKWKTGGVRSAVDL